MSELFAPGLALRETTRSDGAPLLRCTVFLPEEQPDILSRFSRWADSDPDRPLITAPGEGDARSVLSYGQAAREAALLAAFMIGPAGLRPGDVIATLAPAGADALRLKLACLMAGLVHAALPPFPFRDGGGGADGERLLRIAQARVIFTPRGHPASAHPLARPLGATIAEAVAAGLSLAARQAAPKEIAAIFFTSGSTGVPKGVPITRRMISACQGAISAMWPFLAQTPPVLIDWLPWHHVFGGLDNIFKVIWHGGAMHLDAPPAAGPAIATLRLMAETRPTLHIAVPLSLKLLLDAIDLDPARGSAAVSRLKAIFFAGAGIDEALWLRLKDFRDRLGSFEIVSGYGATEAGSTICLSPAPLERAGELGVPLPGHDLALVEADGRHEVRLRGPTVAPHYLTETGPAPLPCDELGYFRTGDAAILRERGDGARVLAFDGRLAEDFKLSNGVKVRTGSLRADLLASCAPLLREIVVAGENAERLVALVFPAAEPDEFTAAEITVALGRWNRENPGRTTAIARFAFAPAPADREQGELSDKGQIIRTRYLRNHARIIAELQAGGGHAPS